MPTINFVYRGCTVDIQIADQADTWEISIRVMPFDGVELIEPFGARELKLAKGDSLDLIQAALIDEIQSAIDHRLVGGG
ncbi:hypothetical protein PMO31116_03605 [Pandoraea morbifera]|uniref:Uncharacterized protein n=1 Tax=Pandoraea morbifera TaxID=2508300 RepID=A0A5E4X3V4_9BURK|nr:hypothetical protein [Pandoraea morbifera]VVE30932.1 hypothetical protein PMO31116_03605 [Pandoraea morbifera]